MGLEEGINQPVGPNRLVARQKQWAVQECHHGCRLENNSDRVTDKPLSP
jgi:hypothetical protein